MNPIDELRKMLTDENIPYEDYKEQYPLSRFDNEPYIHRLYGEASKWSRNQIIYGRYNDHRRKHEWKIDAIFQRGSYGCTQGFVETYGTLGVDEKNNPMTLKPSEVFKIIVDDWNKLSDEERNALRG